MTDQYDESFYNRMRELIQARDALAQLASLTPEGLPEEVGTANSYLLEMVSNRVTAAIDGYISASAQALSVASEGPEQASERQIPT